MNGEVILNFKDIQRLTKKSRPTIWRWEQRGLFPKSFKIGPNSVGWLKSSIDQWVEEKANGA